MPPNRKETFDLTGNTATLSGRDIEVSQGIAKFPLLMSLADSATEEGAKKAINAEIVVGAPSIHDEYSLIQLYSDCTLESNNDIKKETLIRQIIEEERIRQLLSIDSLQENVATQQVKRIGPIEIIYNPAKDDGYWDTAEESPQKDVEIIKADHTSDMTHPLQLYWNWDTEDFSNKLIVEKLLEENENRQLLSVQNLEQQLRQVKFVGSAATKKENDSYWDWIYMEDTPPSHRNLPSSSWEEEKKSLIHLISEAEEISGQFMIESIQEQLVKTSFGASEHERVTVRSKGCSLEEESSYWDW